MTDAVQVLGDILKTAPHGRALDVATGAGNFAESIEKSGMECTEILAVDSMVKPLEILAHRVQSDVIIAAAMDGEKLALPDSSFSVAAISNSLHHLSDPVAVLREMIRILIPGGMLIVNEMFSGEEQKPAQSTHSILHNWWGAVDSSSGVVHNPVYTRNELEKLVGAVGLVRLKFRTFEDLSGDPFDKKLLDQLGKVCEIYMSRTGENNDLKKRGIEAVDHMNRFGFTAARSLVAYGCKPS